MIPWIPSDSIYFNDIHFPLCIYTKGYGGWSDDSMDGEALNLFGWMGLEKSSLSMGGKRKQGIATSLRM